MTRWSPKITYKDVERVHAQHPGWNSREIAKALDCGTAYVRATANRRKLAIAKERRPISNTSISLPLEKVRPLCRKGESPRRCLARILDDTISGRRIA